MRGNRPEVKSCVCIRKQIHDPEFFRIGVATLAVRNVERWQSWLNARDSKSCMPVTVSGVRIPSSPPIKIPQQKGYFLWKEVDESPAIKRRGRVHLTTQIIFDKRKLLIPFLFYLLSVNISTHNPSVLTSRLGQA